MLFNYILRHFVNAQSCLTLCDPVDCIPQASLSMGFSRQEYWSGLPFPSPLETLVMSKWCQNYLWCHFSHSVFATPWTAACQASLSITNSQPLLKLMSIELVMPSNHLILCCPLLFPPAILPASGSSPMSQFFTSGGQSIGVSASASVLPKNIQDWFPLGWTGCIPLKSKGLSRVFSSTTVQKHQFFSTQLSLVLLQYSCLKKIPWTEEPGGL